MTTLNRIAPVNPVKGQCKDCGHINDTNLYPKHPNRGRCDLCFGPIKMED